MGEAARPYHCLAPQTWSVLDFVRTDLRTLRLAIATWEEGASWRAQGWAGENGDHSDRALHPSQVASKSVALPFKKDRGLNQDALQEKERASLEGVILNLRFEI
jgi:hypothetical protein